MPKNNIQLFFRISRRLQRWFAQNTFFRLSQNYAYTCKWEKFHIKTWHKSEFLGISVILLDCTLSLLPSHQISARFNIPYECYGVFPDSESEKSATSGWNYSNPFPWKTDYTMRISMKNCIAYLGINQIGKLIFR